MALSSCSSATFRANYEVVDLGHERPELSSAATPTEHLSGIDITPEEQEANISTMSLLPFLSEAVFISLSGVMAPGPVTAVTLGKGNESPYAGSLVALGHGLVEFPLMALIFLGFGRVLSLSWIQVLVALVGGLLLVTMGIGMLRSARQIQVSADNYAGSPITAGILLTVGNPYFLVWWATVGAALILRSATFGLAGLVLFAVLHWSCDLLWCSFLSALSFKGGQFFGSRFQMVVFALCGVLLLVFGGRFVLDALSAFLA